MCLGRTLGPCNADDENFAGDLGQAKGLHQSLAAREWSRVRFLWRRWCVSDVRCCRALSWHDANAEPRVSLDRSCQLCQMLQLRRICRIQTRPLQGLQSGQVARPLAAIGSGKCALDATHVGGLLALREHSQAHSRIQLTAHSASNSPNNFVASSILTNTTPYRAHVTLAIVMSHAQSDFPLFLPPLLLPQHVPSLIILRRFPWRLRCAKECAKCIPTPRTHR